MSESSMQHYRNQVVAVAVRQYQGWPEPADLRDIMAIPYCIGDTLKAPDGTIHRVRVTDGFDGTARCLCGWSETGHWYDIRANGRRHLLAEIG